jgi:lysozyme family protein
MYLDDLTKRLINTHPEQAEVIIEKQQVIQNQWSDLTNKADQHKVCWFFLLLLSKKTSSIVDLLCIV